MLDAIGVASTDERREHLDRLCALPAEAVA